MDLKNTLMTGLNVTGIEAQMKKFETIDYSLFAAMLLMCTFIGLYFAFVKKTENQQDYLVGGRSMNTFPVGMSLIASYISGISLLGIPTEVYVYGIQYAYIVGGVVIMAIIGSNIYLPVFHELNLTSTYEYHERRFDKRLRVFGSVLFTIGLLAWLPVVIYIPALAFNQVTGVNVHFITPLVCLVCIFYTSLGGIKAVVWTDVIQIMIMIGSMALVAIKGTFDIGGIGVVLSKNLESGRLEAPNFDFNPMTRHTVWALVIGGFVNLLQSSCVNQDMMQRYLSLPTIKAATRAMWIFVLGVALIVGLCAYCGMLIFAAYHECDPLTTKLAREKDQLLPLMVMNTLKDMPGLPGVFIAGIFSAALSSLSTGLNSMAAVVLEDFYKPFCRSPLNDHQTYLMMKVTVIIFGAICVGLVFVVQKLGPVLQLTLSVGAIAQGASLGISTMGILMPWINSTGALSGGIASLTFMSWLCLRTQTLIVAGDITFSEKPVTTEGCDYSFTPKIVTNGPVTFNSTATLMTNITHADERFMIYRLSYLWYALIGTIVAVIVGLLVSWITGPLDPKDVDPQLLAPFVRKLIKYETQQQAESTDGTIVVSEDSNHTNINNEIHKQDSNDIPLETYKKTLNDALEEIK